MTTPTNGLMSRHPSSLRLLALLLLTACGGESTSVQVEVDVASVTLEPAAPTVEVGLSLQFRASALNSSGQELYNQTVTWTSSATAVATISDDGVATGVSVGSSEIRATVGGVEATQTLTVSPSTCTTPTGVALSPGEYASFAGTECLLLPAGSAGDMYRVAVARPTVTHPAPTNTSLVTLSIAPVLLAAPPAEVAEAQPPAAVLRDQEALPLLDGTRALERLRWQDATRRFHLELRRRERSLGLERSALLPSPVGAAPPAPVDPLATRDMYLELSCSSDTPQPVELVGFSDHIAVYQEAAERDTAAISTQAANELIQYYDLYVRDMTVDYWGRRPDTDANGRVLVVTTPELGENVAAAVWSGDFFQRLAGCPGSNEGEVIYFSGDVLRALDPPGGETESSFALGVLAHEAKHVTSLYNGIERGDLLGISNAFHDLWVEEGTAEVSQVMSSRIAWAATGGPALGEAITATDILLAVRNNGGREPPEMSGIVDAMAGIARSFSVQPNSLLTDPAGAPEEHSFYFNSWLWHRFLGDAFGDASTALADTTFFRMLTDPTTPAGAARGEIQLSGRGSFEQLFEDFVVAASLNGSGHAAAYPIDTWDLVTAGSIFRQPNPEGDFPWPVTATEVQDAEGRTVSVTQWAPFESDSYTSLIGPSGVRFHDFRSSGTAGAQIRVVGAEDGVVIVTRLD